MNDEGAKPGAEEVADSGRIPRTPDKLRNPYDSLVKSYPLEPKIPDPIPVKSVYNKDAFIRLGEEIKKATTPAKSGGGQPPTSGETNPPEESSSEEPQK